MVSLIRGNLFLTAWLGDSQAVLVKDGVATQLVNPHKPDRIVNNSTNLKKTTFKLIVYFSFLKLLLPTGREGKDIKSWR